MDLRTTVNPTYFTAKSTALLLAKAGNPDAAEFIQGTGISSDTLTDNSMKSNEADHRDPLSAEDRAAIMTGVTLSIEARYSAVTAMLEKGGYKNLLDIGCGYTPRSLFCNKAGIDYVGMDVPVVAEELQKFASAKFEGKSHDVYVGGDATNAASLKAAADLLKGEVMISCEGLLGYLSLDETEQFVGGIREVLKEHGGAWYTSDWGVNYQDFATFSMSSPEAVQIYTEAKNHAMKASNIINPGIGFRSDEEIEEFIKSHGLKVEKLPFYTEDEKLLSLDGFAPDMKEKALEILNKSTLWKMTVDESASVTERISGAKTMDDLVINYFLFDDWIKCITKGRIDTISAPALLEIIKDYGEGMKSLIIDAAHLDYISSAGLRVLLIALKDIGEVKILHASDELKDIFEATGFDQMLTIED